MIKGLVTVPLSGHLHLQVKSMHQTSHVSSIVTI